MDSSSVRKILDFASKPPTEISKRFLPPDYSKDNFTFRFRYLILDYDEYPCCEPKYHKYGKKLIRIFETLKVSSRNNKFSIEGNAHCHDIEESRLIDKKLEVFVSKFKGKKFFQFGMNGNAERIIGFFNDDNSHVFEVCLFDLEHQIFPQTKRRVYD